MDKIRVRYSKTGIAKYISHLDLMTVMQRSFIRAGVNLSYSEGFNPHPYISVALPASVGVESGCELMDVALTGGSISDDANRYMPEGLKIQKAYKAWRKFNDIKWLETEYKLSFDNISINKIAEALCEKLSGDSLTITKKTKRGTSEIDVAPHIKETKVFQDDDTQLIMSLKLSAQNPTISHKDIANIIEIVCTENNFPLPSNINAKRIEIYDANMVLFK